MGPLLNDSQFLPERVIGELGKHVHALVRPEANIFHSSHFLFALRMVSGGLQTDLGTKNDDIVEGNPDTSVNGICETQPEFELVSSPAVERPVENQSSAEPYIQLLGKGKVLDLSERQRIENVRECLEKSFPEHDAEKK